MLLKGNKKVTVQVKAKTMSKSSLITLSDSYRDDGNNGYEPKLCQNVSQGMKKVPYNSGSLQKQTLKSRSDHVRSLNENIV